MSPQQQAAEGVAPVVTREFVGRRAETDDVVATLSVESQAALRQFSLERTVAYGVDYADAVEMRARVLDGQSWRHAAATLADTCLRRADGPHGAAAPPTRIAYLRRASALLRMSQMMMLSDTAERRAVFVGSAQLYGQAADLCGDRAPVRLESDGGPLAGWFHRAPGTAVASAVVVGGVEGWAMDFASIGEAFAARGVDVLMLDAPGQGETRFVHHHYLSARWREAYRCAVDFLDERAPGRPIGIVGNSMGGSFAVAVAAADARIRACVDNGGVTAPQLLSTSKATFFAKMVAVCGTEDAGAALDVWETVTPLAEGPNADFPLLVVQGGRDPLVSGDMARELLQGAPTDDKQMVVFSDGDHCVYNHLHDRDALIADWTRARLCGLPAPDIAA